MKGDRDSLLPLLILPGIHLIFCIGTDMFVGEEFKWIMVTIIDFPVFMGAVMLGLSLTPFVEYTVVGTLWWFVIGAVWRFFYKRMVEC